jgi:ribosomal protein S12 methylthiotransferase accessory factor
VSVTEPHQSKKLLELVSSKVGVIRSLSPVVRGAEEPNPPILYQAMLSHFDFRKSTAWERSAGGKGLTESEAIQGAIGEAIEHYCASHFDPYTTRREPWSSVAPEAVAPHELVLYSASQYSRAEFPYRQWNPLDEVTWLPLTELPTNRQISVPPLSSFWRSARTIKKTTFVPLPPTDLRPGQAINSRFFKVCTN